MSIELPKSDNFLEARESIEALVRSQPETFGAHDIDDDGEVGPLVENQSLCDWSLTTHWIDEEGEHRYCRVNSTMTPHALKGLMQMFDD
jgi:hypothetical protein